MLSALNHFTINLCNYIQGPRIFQSVWKSSFDLRETEFLCGSLHPKHTVSTGQALWFPSDWAQLEEAACWSKAWASVWSSVMLEWRGSIHCSNPHTKPDTEQLLDLFSICFQSICLHAGTRRKQTFRHYKFCMCACHASNDCRQWKAWTFDTPHIHLGLGFKVDVLHTVTI